MPTLAVIAVPEFSSADAAWIATLRTLHDPLHEQIGPHITLRFPNDPPRAATFAAGVALAAAATRPFAVALDRLALMDDPHRPKYRHLVVVLADATGAARLAALQVMLGEGAAGPPHMTICRFGAIYSARALLRQTGGLARPLRGYVAALDLLRIEHGRIERLARHALSAPLAEAGA